MLYRKLIVTWDADDYDGKPEDIPSVVQYIPANTRPEDVADDLTDMTGFCVLDWRDDDF